MEYIKSKDKIIIKDKSEFNAEHILECGQVFRYKKIGSGYEVFSLDKKATIIESDKQIEILSKDIEYFENYFDLKNDYSLVKQECLKLYNNRDDFMQKAIDYGYGIRILNQDYFEMILSFLISQNNNIKRIQLIVNKLCEKYGKNMGEFFAFPTIDELKNISEKKFQELGLGYRAGYMVSVIEFLQTFDIDNFKKLSTVEAINELLKVNGIGPKVADCIMLFGFHKMDVFPVDVWVAKIYKTIFKDDETDRKKMRFKLVDLFKDKSGYAQQYLFYYKRSL